MPTKRRPRLKEMNDDFDVLDEWQEYELLHGQSLLGGSLFDDDAMREAWELHRDRLMAAWIAERPGTRPFSWWLFEGVPKYGERPIVDKEWEAVYVREAFLVHGILHTQIVHPATLKEVQEPEREFLARHGELMEGE